eukprot:79049-Rhodomonas_salina.1
MKAARTTRMLQRVAPEDDGHALTHPWTKHRLIAQHIRIGSQHNTSALAPEDGHGNAVDGGAVLDTQHLLVHLLRVCARACQPPQHTRGGTRVCLCVSARGVT